MALEGSPSASGCALLSGGFCALRVHRGTAQQCFWPHWELQMSGNSSLMPTGSAMGPGIRMRRSFCIFSSHGVLHHLSQVHGTQPWDILLLILKSVC